MEPHSKTCYKCEEAKPRTEFNKNRKNKDGLQATCKVCRKQYRQENREQIAEYDRKYRQENREQLAEYKKQYYRENREQIAEYDRKYYQENREYYKQYSKKWRQENPEYSKQRRQENPEYFKQWRQENPEKVAANRAKRRALEQDAIPDALRDCPVEKGRLEQIYKLRDIFTKATGVQYHVDHIWPLSKGGPHWSGNLQVITAEENLSKSASFCEDTARVIEESLHENLSTRQ